MNTETGFTQAGGVTMNDVFDAAAIFFLSNAEGDIVRNCRSCW